MKTRIALWAILFVGVSAVSEAQMTDLPVAESTSLWASSILVENLRGRRVEYGPDALFDGDLSTCWAEAAEGPGLGENVLILCQRPVTEIRIHNGFASSSYLYRANNRPRNLRISIVAGLTAPGMVTEGDTRLYKVIETTVDTSLHVRDTREEQRFDFPISAEAQYRLMRDAIAEFREAEDFLFGMICRELEIDPEKIDIDEEARLIIAAYGFYAVRLTIESVYAGGRYDDTCLSEVSLEFTTF